MKRKPISLSYMPPTVLIIFSSVFLVIGVYIIGLSLKIFIVTEKVNAPREMILLVGLVFFFSGFAAFTKGVANWIKCKRREKLKQKYVETPWKWDYGWKRRGIKSRSKRSLFRHMIVVCITCCFLGITYWIGFIDKAQLKLPFFGVSFFSLFILLRFYKMISKRIKYGKAYLNFSKLPYFLGENLNIRFSHLPSNQEVKAIKVSIRFYEEVYIKDARNQTQISLNEKYIDIKKLGKNSISPRSELNVEFNLPTNIEFSTELSSIPAHFWEVEIECDIGGLDYREYFLLPIYNNSL